jgi:hypothetical protein
MNQIQIEIENKYAKYYDSPEQIELIRNEYRKYVEKMNPREFAEMIIKEGSFETRIEILQQIQDFSNIKLPTKLVEQMDIQKINSSKQIILNFIEDLDLQYPITSTENFNGLYYDYVYWSMENGYKSMCKREFKKTISEKLDKDSEEKFKNLTDLDCKLMKLSHLIK